jgi:hypothetical protein
MAKCAGRPAILVRPKNDNGWLSLKGTSISDNQKLEAEGGGGFNPRTR